MSRRVKRLTPSMLRRLVLEEKAKMLRESDPIEAGIDDVAKVDADEVKAGDEADTIAKDIDIMAALKIEEGKLLKTSILCGAALALSSYTSGSGRDSGIIDA